MRFALIALALTTACTRGGWADGTWKIDDASRGRIHDANESAFARSVTLSLVDSARLEIFGERARLHLEGYDETPLDYEVARVGPQELGLDHVGTADTAPHRAGLRCESFDQSACTRLRVVTILGVEGYEEAGTLTLDRAR